MPLTSCDKWFNDICICVYWLPALCNVQWALQMSQSPYLLCLCKYGISVYLCVRLFSPIESDEGWVRFPRHQPKPRIWGQIEIFQPKLKPDNCKLLCTTCPSHSHTYQPYFLINYRFSQKLKLLRNREFNHLIIFKYSSSHVGSDSHLLNGVQHVGILTFKWEVE